jgi:hypothetical protein
VATNSLRQQRLPWHTAARAICYTCHGAHSLEQWLPPQWLARHAVAQAIVAPAYICSRNGCADSSRRKIVSLKLCLRRQRLPMLLEQWMRRQWLLRCQHTFARAMVVPTAAATAYIHSGIHSLEQVLRRQRLSFARATMPNVLANNGSTADFPLESRLWRAL